MKKLIAIMLCLCMVLPVFGCAKEETTEIENTTLQVGYGRVDISPYDLSMPLRGYGNPLERFSTEVEDPIYATCVAFTDVNGNTILLYHMDLCTAYSELLMNRRSISKATGVPTSNIMISATHNHSSPELNVTNDAVSRYVELLQEWMVEAAEAAMADRKPAEMYMTTTTLENMNFVRHYVMSDGSIVGDNFGSPSGKTYVKHTVDADNTMQILRFVREGGKDVVMVNWQTHPLRNSSSTSTRISSDIVGTMRDYVEEKMGCNFAYFSGASGNIDPSSRISKENVTYNYVEQGQKMGEYAVAACQNMTKVNTHNVQVTSETYTASSTTESDRDFDIFAFSIGDVGFICAPYEMFSENGQQIKEGSPFKMTFVITYANGGNAYVASEATYAYGGYEVEYHNYVKGTAEELVTRYIALLNQLYPTR